MRAVFIAAICLLIPALGAAQKPKAKAKATPAAPSESITLDANQWAPQKDKVLSEAKELAETSSTARESAAYVRRHMAFSNTLAKANTSDWTEDEKAILAKVEAPSEEARKLYAKDQEESERRLRAREQNFDQQLAIDGERAAAARKRSMEERESDARYHQKKSYNRVFNGLFNYSVDQYMGADEHEQRFGTPKY